MREARAAVSSGRNEISGASRRRSDLPTRARKCPATLSSPSNVAARAESLPITLTNTVACRRSRVTSAPVTVTSPATRGSLTSVARKVATSSRIASATRSGRRFSLAICGLRRGDGRLEGSRELLGAVALDDVADLEVVEVLHADATLESFPHFASVVLEPLERRERTVEHLDAVPDDAHATLAVDDAIAHRATGDRADARDLEYLADFRLAQHHFALFRTEHAFHRRAHVGNRFVDDPVQLDLDAFALSRGARVVVRPDVEANDDRAGGLGEQDVAFGDRADAAVHDVDLDFRGRQAAERVGQGLGRSALVCLDENLQHVHLTGCRLRHEVFQGDAATRATPAARLAIEPLTPLGDLASRGGILDDEHLVARHWHTFESEDLHRNRRTSRLDVIAPLVEQCADASRVHPADEIVPTC